MNKSSSLSHVQWQGSARWKQGWSGAWKGWDDSQISDERVTMALHTMQDHLQQTTVIAQRRPQKMLFEQSASETKGDAAYEAIHDGPHPSA